MKYNAFFIAWAVVLTVATNANAQDERPLQLSFNTIRTNLEQAAFKLSATYIPDNQSLMADRLVSYPKGLFSLSQEMAIETGNNDAFSSIRAKAAGFFMFFDITTRGGQRVARMDKVLHVLPISAGIETSNAFRTVNGIVEIGYTPWYQLRDIHMPRVLKYTKIGVFLQGGYKFDAGSGNLPTGRGGNVDQSKEQAESALCRVKGHFSVDTKRLLASADSGRGLGLIGRSDVWYDLLHSEWYYRIEGKLRVYLSRERFFDFTYEKGSGAPNFNQGEQFGAGLTITF